MKRFTGDPVPERMGAWLLHGPGDLRQEQREVRRPGPGEVLLRIGSVGVCGSDKHFYLEGRASSDVMNGPFVLGHEFGGRIVGIGPGVDADRLGHRVSVEPLVPDLTCAESLRGRYNLDPDQAFFGVPGTDGALQEYLVVPARNAFDIPDAISDDAAAMVETISVSLNGVRKAGVGVGSRVLVTGAGPIGLFAVQLALIAGAAQVVVVEPQGARRAMAEGFGAQGVPGLDELDGGFDSLIECTGVQAVRHDGLMQVAPGGRGILIGVGAQDASLPMPAIIEREVMVQGVMRYAFTWPTVIDALAAGRVVTDRLVSRRLPFAQASLAWTDPQPDEIKTIIQVDAPAPRTTLTREP